MPLPASRDRVALPMPTVLALVFAIAAIAAVPATARQAQPAPAQAAAAPAQPADEVVVATFDGGQITRSEVLDYLGQYVIVPERQQEVYEAAINAMINGRLLDRHIEEQGVTVAPAEIDAEVEKVRAQLKEQGQGDLNNMLADLSMTPGELREQLGQGLRRSKFFLTRADDATLEEYFEKNKDIFTGTLVKASHILIQIDPDASEEQVEAARSKLLDLKKQIEAGELDFAVAADNYSEDPANQETPDGGNIGYFARRGQVVDAFADAAFELEVGAVSDPVRTDFGLHLIKLTDRREGDDLQFEEIRDDVLGLYVQEQQESLIESLRAQAKIDIKPMPEDFFPEPSTTAPAPAPARRRPRRRPAADAGSSEIGEVEPPLRDGARRSGRRSRRSPRPGASSAAARAAPGAGRRRGSARSATGSRRG